jgi:adhesin HecA-like repeat protein
MTATLNIKGNVNITDGSLDVAKGDMTVTQGDLTVVAGKLYLGSIEVVGGSLVPDAQGNVTLTGNLTVPATKTITIGTVTVGVNSGHLSIGGVQIWAG